MKVFKFGGASVKDASGVRNLERIVRMNSTSDGLMVVVSAMGKTTNALERVVDYLEAGKEEMALTQWVDIIDHHVAIMKELGLQPGSDIRLQGEIPFDPALPYDQNYDQIVSLGEIMSTQIIAVYLLKQGLSVEWWNMPKLLRTDATWREAVVDDAVSSAAIRADRRYGRWLSYDPRSRRFGLYRSPIRQLSQCRVGYHLERCAGYPQRRSAY